MTESQFLKSARKRAKLSQIKVAKHLKYKTSQFVCNWERGVSSIPLNKVHKFCKLTGALPSEFISLRMAEYSKTLKKAFGNAHAK